MDSISGVTNKRAAGNPVITNTDAESYASDFAALLQMVGSNVQGNGTWAAVESKFLRDDNKREIEPKAEPRDSNAVGKDRKDDRDVKRANNDRKGKSDKDDDSATSNAAKSAGAAKGETDQNAAAQAAAQAAAAAVPVEVPLGAEGEAAVVTEEVAQVAAVTEVLPEQTAAATVEAEVIVGPAVAATATGPVKAETTVVQNDPAAAIVEQADEGVDVQAQQVVKADPRTEKAEAKAGPAVQVVQNPEQTAKAADPAAQAAQEQRSAAAAEQADALSRKLGDDAHLRIQVKVDGRQAADTRFQWSSYNQFVGYNPADLRTISTANGQAGQAEVTNAVLQNGADSPAELIAPQTSPSSSSASNGSAQQGNAAGGPSAIRAEAAVPQARGGETPSHAGNHGSGSGSFANTLAQTTGASSPSQPAAAERPASAQVIEQIKVNITRAAKAGLDKVTIQLKPQDLGRIEVKLELSDDGKVRAMVTADVKDTLELLQRDARGLERALNDAGLRTDSDNLHFNLRGENDPKLASDAEHGKSGRDGGDAADGDAPAEDDIEYQYDYARAAWLRGGVDTFA